MKRYLAAISGFVLALGGLLIAAPVASAAPFTPIHVYSVNAQADEENYNLNIKMNRQGVITRDNCRFNTDIPRDKTRLQCLSVTSLTRDGNAVTFSGSMEIRSSVGDVYVEPFTIQIVDNATPGAGADTMTVIFGGSGSQVTLTEGDFIIE